MKEFTVYMIECITNGELYINRGPLPKFFSMKSKAEVLIVQRRELYKKWSPCPGEEWWKHARVIEATVQY